VIAIFPLDCSTGNEPHSRRRGGHGLLPTAYPKRAISIPYPPRVLVFLASLAVSAPPAAMEKVALSIGHVDGGSWSGSELTLELDFPGANHVSARLRGGRLALPAPFDTLRSINLDCARGAVNAEGVACAGAELRLDTGEGAPEALPLSMHLDRSKGEWRLALASRALPPARLWAFAVGRGLVPALEIGGGALDLSAELTSGSPAPAAHLRALLTGLTFSDAQGLHAGEALGAALDWRVMRRGPHWSTHARLIVDSGQVFLDPVYVDAGAAPLSVTADGAFDPAAGRLELSELKAEQQAVAAVHGSLSYAAAAGLESLDLDLSPSSLSPLYRTYLQPFAIGTLFDALRVEGAMDGHLQWRPSPDGQRVQLNFHHAGIEDRDERFALLGLDGHLDWAPSEGADASMLSWRGGQLYRIDIGAGMLRGRFAGRRFDLRAPLRVPLLEGAVQIDTLEAASIGTPDLEWSFRGAVQPMSLEALTRALGWPLFAGSLAGDIPLVSYAGGTIRVDGSLDVRVFDGAVRIRQLSIADPFGVIPVLRAEVDVQDLSLDALTSTFSFGKIQGKLQGRVHGLILKDWKPTSFDAQFATPEDDGSRHRISQRAVENLASLGGAGAVLSSTFLRIFDEFSYRRLGISCRLSGGVCQMAGVAPAERGYYIVEGGGLPPRIDVIGFNERVDWPVLLGRLKQINSAEGPVVR
jgi:hypothetical protein